MSATTIGILAIVGLFSGVANALPPQKIVGGSPAAAGEFPYQVSLRYWNQHICGGTIISERHIITAAHCVVDLNPRLLRIATGTISVSGGQLHDIKEITYHAKYIPDDDGSPNDIAIITLKSDIKFDKNQDKLDLPTEPTPADVTAVVTGWGLVQAKSRSSSPKLLKVEVKTLSNKQCQRTYGRGGDIQENQLCTYGGRGHGTCQGDSGGPLAYNGHLVGIVSWGIPCAVGAPDVFTSVYHQLDWINRVIKGSK